MLSPPPDAMFYSLRLLVLSLLVPQKAFRSMAIENLALRQQLSTYLHNRNRPRISSFGKIFWMFLSKVSPSWKETLVIVKPETVVGWHRKGFKLFWRWHLRQRVQAEGHKSCHRRGCHRAKIPLAKSIRGTGNWINQARMPQPLYRSR